MLTVFITKWLAVDVHQDRSSDIQSPSKAWNVSRRVLLSFALCSHYALCSSEQLLTMVN